MKKITFIFLYVAFNYAYSQVPDLIYLKNIEGESFISGRQISNDRNNNTYISGDFRDSLSYQSIRFVSKGSSDAFVIKLDSLGNVIWGSTFGSTKLDQMNAMTIDSYGNSYVLVQGRSDISIDGKVVLEYDEWIDYSYLMKIDSGGEFKWARTIGIEIGLGRDSKIIVDENNNLYLTSTFGDSLVFAGQTIHNINRSPFVRHFIASIDSSGNDRWINTFDSRAVDIIYHDNSIYAIGFENDSARFGNEVIKFPEEFSEQIFLTKFTSEGEFQHAKFIGGQGLEELGFHSLSFDEEDKMCVAFSFSDSLLIEEDTLYAGFSKDLLIAKYNTDGGLVDYKQYAGSSHIDFRDSFYSSGELLITGSFEGVWSIGDETIMENEKDFFIMSIGDNGSLNWIQQSDSPEPEFVSSLSKAGNKIHVLGNFSNNVSFLGETLNKGNTYFLQMESKNVTTNLEQYFDDSEPQVYPNPCQDEVIINNFLINENMISVSFIDSKGMKNNNFTFEDKKSNLIDVSHLPSGLYMLSIQTNKTIYNKVVLKK